MLLAGVVGDEKARKSAGKVVAGAVPERKRGGSLNFATLFQQSEKGAQCDSSQGEKGPRAKDLEFALEIRAAVGEFGGKRFVGRRSAAERRGNICAGKSEAVFAADRARLIGEARAMERLVQKIAGAIAREHAARAIRAVGRGREAENQKPGPRIAKTRNGLAPVFTVAKSEALLTCNFFTIAHQAGTRPAGDDLAVQVRERVQRRLWDAARRVRRPPTCGDAQNSGKGRRTGGDC